MNEPPPLLESRWCSRCGASIQPGANFCHACGAAVTKSALTPQSLANKPPASRPKNRPVLAMVLMLGFIGLIVYAVYETNKESAPQMAATPSPIPQVVASLPSSAPENRSQW